MELLRGLLKLNFFEQRVSIFLIIVYVSRIHGVRDVDVGFAALPELGRVESVQLVNLVDLVELHLVHFINFYFDYHLLEFVLRLEVHRIHKQLLLNLKVGIVRWVQLSHSLRIRQLFHLQVSYLIDIESLKIRRVLGSEALLQILLQLRVVNHVSAAHRI